MQITLRLLLATAILFALCDLIQAQEQPPTAPPHAYVEIIVTACPADPDSMEQCEKAAVASSGFPTRMCAKAINQGKTYDKERSLSRQERITLYRQIGCIDVPIPPERVQGHTEMTPEACRGHPGYLASMQYLEQNQTITQKAVGGWHCIIHQFPVAGVASF